MRDFNLMFMRISFIVFQMVIEYVVLPVAVGLWFVWLFDLNLIVLVYAIIARTILEYTVRVIAGAYFSEKYSRQGR